MHGRYRAVIRAGRRGASRPRRPRPLEDPTGQGIEAVRPVRDDIRGRVLTLVDELGVAPVPDATA